MKILKNKLENELKLRTEINYPVDGIEFIDITPMFMDSNLLKEMIEKLAEEIKKYKVDYILAPEARGFLLGSSIAEKLGIGVIPIRKKGKLPPTTIEKSFEYEKEYGVDYLELPKLINETYNNKTFYIVDDIYATGNTVRAIIEAVEDLGGEVVASGVIINIKELNNDNVFSLIEIEEENI